MHSGRRQGRINTALKFGRMGLTRQGTGTPPFETWGVLGNLPTMHRATPRGPVVRQSESILKSRVAALRACFSVASTNPTWLCVLDWSLITGRGGGGGYKMGKSQVRNFVYPPLSAPSLVKGGNSLCPPFNMAKTSCNPVKTTQNIVCPPLSVISDQSLRSAWSL